jgi:glycosyltransferase involved in cell wall biosynthesis
MISTVWHVIDTLDTGGAERMVADLALAQSRTRPVAICCLKHRGPVAQSLAGAPVRVVELGKGEGNDYRLPFRLASLLRRERVGIVHSHDWGVFCETAVASILGGTGAFFHTAHGDFHPPGNSRAGRVKWRIRRNVERALSPALDGLVAVSWDLKARIHGETGIPEREIRVIRNGARFRKPDREGSARLRESLGIPSEAFLVVTVARLAPVKNLGLLLYAIRRVRESRQSARLLIVGDGPERDSLRETATRIGIADSVALPGERDDIADCLGISNLYVNCSVHEGISLAILEAFSAGLPVIATAVGGNRELIEHGRNGILVPDGDPDRLAAEIVRLMDDAPERRRLGIAGARKAETEYSFDAMVNSYETLYRSAEEKRGRGNR